ncbi:type VI secretion system lipoprotein TssJ [Massilia soli]|uniref:Type VI secretion system lipoprotein TssJ n=1 Tax=Massilia soli TaxID=2792854 RepID=A0ABS7SME5_9BURK|nr:type VI secretion system lipoprotein TssJ [Massilia soli]MBZ2207340.1 type VI secretion system lipoprotein TssJ [Massilia soli]
MRQTCLLPLLFSALLAGCASRSTPEPTRNVAIRLHAANALNVDAQGRPLAVLTRIYTLRQDTAFRQAPYDAFLTPHKEKEALGADLIDVKEVMLVPGQRHDVVERISRDASFVGIVALFHAPAPQRWRLAYAAAEAAQGGITVGVHGCSLSSGAGANAIGTSATLPSPVRCQ